MRISDWSSDVCSSDLLQLLNSVLVQLACTPIPGAPALPTSKLAPVPDPASFQEWETLAPIDCAPYPTDAPADHPSDQPLNAFRLLYFMPPGPPPKAKDRKSTRLNSSH